MRDLLLALQQNSSRDADGLVLRSSTGQPVDPKNFVRTFQLIATNANLPRITVHHTRHTAATLLKNLGVSVRDVQLILGHSNITTTQEIYQHGDITGQREALTRVANALNPQRTNLASMSADEQAEADNCCQEWLSTETETIEHEESQAKKNRRSTEVDAAVFLGGTTGA